MNLGELIDNVVTMMGGQGEPTEADIANMLNRVMNEDARDLRIPEMTAEFNGVTLPFNLPVGGLPGGVLRVFRKSDGWEFPVHTNDQANHLYPGYLNWSAGDTRFVVFDPATIGLEGTVYPAPVPDVAQDYLVTFTKRPEPMVALDDEPFDGVLPEYHRLLAHHAAFELLMAASDNRWQPHYSRYTKLMSEAFTYARPAPVTATRPGWSD